MAGCDVVVGTRSVAGPISSRPHGGRSRVPHEFDAAGMLTRCIPSNAGRQTYAARLLPARRNLDAARSSDARPANRSYRVCLEHGRRFCALALHRRIAVPKGRMLGSLGIDEHTKNTLAFSAGCYVEIW
jgi:hypothetical protein